MTIATIDEWQESVAAFSPVPLHVMTGTTDEQEFFRQSLNFPGVYAWTWHRGDNIVYVGRTAKHICSRMREHLLGFLSPAYILGEKGFRGSDRWGYDLKKERSRVVLRHEDSFIDLMRRKHRYFQELCVVARRLKAPYSTNWNRF